MNRLDDLNRTERYFTSTLLGGLLLYNNLEGVREFLNWLGRAQSLKLYPIIGGDSISWQASEILPEHVEIITELNIKRELGHYGKKLKDKELSGLSPKQNVPDVVIVYDQALIVIEGKFFVRNQGSSFIDNQLALQKEEIALMVNYLNPEIEYTCHIFLGPENSCHLSNCDLAITWKDIEDFSREWVGGNHYITHRLKNARERYNQYNASVSDADRINYKAINSLAEVKKLCREYGSAIWVGYQGGEKELIHNDYHTLLHRKFKWDYRDDPTGKKVLQNWIPGDLFLMRSNELELASGKTSGSASERASNNGQSKNYFDKTNFNGIISLCSEHGDNLIIGINGGANVMINTPRDKLENRWYKYDFKDRALGKKKASNWLSASEFMRILREYFS